MLAVPDQLAPQPVEWLDLILYLDLSHQLAEVAEVLQAEIEPEVVAVPAAAVVMIVVVVMLRAVQEQQIKVMLVVAQLQLQEKKPVAVVVAPLPWVVMLPLVLAEPEETAEMGFPQISMDRQQQEPEVVAAVLVIVLET